MKVIKEDSRTTATRVGLEKSRFQRHYIFREFGTTSKNVTKSSVHSKSEAMAHTGA